MTRPKPITDPHAGHYQVVVSFRLDPGSDGRSADAVEEHFRDLSLALIRRGWILADLDVAVREIGATGESSEMEGAGP